MDPDFWHRRWRDNDIGFHREEVHPYLPQYWPGLELVQGSKVFVPLCGKSHDMIWLAEQGHEVVGIELSSVAVADFFAEQKLKPVTRNDGAFTISSSGPIEIWCGDIFELPDRVWHNISVIYDRASLVALPEDMQAKFCELFAKKVSSSAPVFLITLDYDPSEMSGPPFNISNSRVQGLFASTHIIKHVNSRDAIEDNKGLRERGLTALQENLHILNRV